MSNTGRFSNSQEFQDPIEWEIARDIRKNPGRVFYPTDDFIEWLDGLDRSAWGSIVDSYKVARQPFTVKTFKDHYIGWVTQGRGLVPADETELYESLYLERQLGHMLEEGYLTTDPREAALHIQDKYTGPKDDEDWMPSFEGLRQHPEGRKRYLHSQKSEEARKAALDRSRKLREGDKS